MIKIGGVKLSPRSYHYQYLTWFLACIEEGGHINLRNKKSTSGVLSDMVQLCRAWRFFYKQIFNFVFYPQGVPRSSIRAADPCRAMDRRGGQYLQKNLQDPKLLSSLVIFKDETFESPVTDKSQTYHKLFFFYQI